jgi:hypothetical protein
VQTAKSTIDVTPSVPKRLTPVNKTIQQCPFYIHIPDKTNSNKAAHPVQLRIVPPIASTVNVLLRPRRSTTARLPADPADGSPLPHPRVPHASSRQACTSSAPASCWQAWTASTPHPPVSSEHLKHRPPPPHPRVAHASNRQAQAASAPASRRQARTASARASCWQARTSYTPASCQQARTASALASTHCFHRSTPSSGTE